MRHCSDESMAVGRGARASEFGRPARATGPDILVAMKFWVLAGVAVLGALYAQLPFREYTGVEYRVGDIPLPSDYQERTEWTFARLMYPNAPGGRYGRGYGFRNNVGIWTQDYPRADRHFVQALRRLTR